MANPATTEHSFPLHNGRPVVALLGNPNTGKSTLFNALTGLRQKVANYPGVTVERVSGITKLDPNITRCSISDAEIVDLPGTYSLAARTQDERVAARLLVGRMDGEVPPSVVLLVLDASNLSRNLYLASQILETELPVVVALTMTDVAENKGISIDGTKLAELLGCPVVPINGRTEEGVDELVCELARAFATTETRPPLTDIPYPGKLRAAAIDLAQTLSAVTRSRGEADNRDISFTEALRIMSEAGGPAELEAVKRLGDSVLPLIEAARADAELGKRSPAIAEGSARHAWATRIVGQCVTVQAPKGDDFSSKLDRVLTHRVFGSLIFLAIMAVVFQSIFEWAGPLMDVIDGAFGSLGEWVGASMGEGLLSSLVVDGVIAGVGGVLIFLPQILILFLFIALLEDSGYMARAAFLADRVFRPFGLTGRSFIPMMSGFACAIPAIMATRSIPNRATRFATILVVPLTSCSARLPVYTLMIGAFIDPEAFLIPNILGMQAATMLGLYLLGIVTAMLVALVLRKSLLKGVPTPFTIELPTYKMPRWKGVLRTVSERGKVFIINAGTIIFAMSILVWALGVFPQDDSVIEAFEKERTELNAIPVADDAKAQEAREAALAAIDNRESAALLEASALGRIGKFVEPAFEPLGWDWRISTAAIASFPAREVVIGVMGTIFSLGGEEDEESEGLRETFQTAKKADGSPLFTLASALSLMVFFALCMQCGASVAAVKREMNSWRWAAFCFGYMTLLAWLGGMITYQVASHFGL